MLWIGPHDQAAPPFLGHVPRKPALPQPNEIPFDPLTPRSPRASRASEVQRHSSAHAKARAPETIRLARIAFGREVNRTAPRPVSASSCQLPALARLKSWPLVAD